jgi:hypothetical protein
LEPLRRRLIKKITSAMTAGSSNVLLLGKKFAAEIHYHDLVTACPNRWTGIIFRA